MTGNELLEELGYKLHHTCKDGTLVYESRYSFRTRLFVDQWSVRKHGLACEMLPLGSAEIKAVYYLQQEMRGESDEDSE